MPNIHASRPSVNSIQSYISAFESAYPGVPVEVKPNRREGTYRVFIRGDAGDRALTLAELQQATIDFQRGKK